VVQKIGIRAQRADRMARDDDVMLRRRKTVPR
jgi:hypothetical protein